MNNSLIATPLILQEATKILGTLNRALLAAGEVAALSSLEKILHHAQASADRYENTITDLRNQLATAQSAVEKETAELRWQVGELRRKVTRTENDFKDHNVAILALVLKGPLPAIKLTERARKKLQGQIVPVADTEPLAQAIPIKGRGAK